MHTILTDTTVELQIELADDIDKCRRLVVGVAKCATEDELQIEIRIYLQRDIQCLDCGKKDSGIICVGLFYREVKERTVRMDRVQEHNDNFRAA